MLWCSSLVYTLFNEKYSKNILKYELKINLLLFLLILSVIVDEPNEPKSRLSGITRFNHGECHRSLQPSSRQPTQTARTRSHHQPRYYIFETLVSSKDRSRIWDQSQFWEDTFLDAAARERDVLGKSWRINQRGWFCNNAHTRSSTLAYFKGKKIVNILVKDIRLVVYKMFDNHFTVIRFGLQRTNCSRVP